MAFIQNPLLRQRWNHISHTTEAVTENAAAGIWSFGHRYITPCCSSVADALDACTSPCLGDREERARRARERDRGARRSRAPEYTFDFYDDWADEFDDGFDDGGGGGGGGGVERHGGILGRITGEDWDRLLAGTGGGGRRRGEEDGGVTVVDQPRRKRGMSYGTRGPAGRRKVAEEDDPTVIPSTAPLGFLGRLPFRIGGTLRYKPSAANLKEHPGQHAHEEMGMEREPLLGNGEEERAVEEHGGEDRQKRQRSNTAGSGATSDSYRSRNDLFPSDGEGEEDAVPLDDEFAVALDRVDDRGSNKTRSSKGKRVEGRSNSGLSLNLARTVSRTTIGSTLSRDSKRRSSDVSMRQVDGAAEIATPTMEDLHFEEEQARREEEEEVERKRRRAAQVALERGLSRDNLAAAASVPQHKDDAVHTDILLAAPKNTDNAVPDEQGAKTRNGTKPDPDPPHAVAISAQLAEEVKKPPPDFVPARLPHFQ
ncbi:hypothetical protein NKR19_g4268 [Coniochaeta hoffmannii]|uniref:Uncharacterized protein n=1 Tax=Coniochaeta hoffmannii TaxID=91930 RepID=A0AA38S4A2_9PEZI|nr:hypothetical protein NKR19_g4268 [Coniochaeta hoffmannii]